MGKLLRIEDKIDTLNDSGLKINSPEFIVLHSQKSYPDFDSLLQLHRSYDWAGVGYHFFVDKNSHIYQARPLQKEGAHSLGFNTRSIGICFYSEDGNPNKASVSAVRDLVEGIRMGCPGLEVISHTQAQLMYINNLLGSSKIDQRFPDGPDTTEARLFDEIKNNVNQLVGSLDSSAYFQLKKSLKDLKNCPGPSFKQFI